MQKLIIACLVLCLLAACKNKKTADTTATSTETPGAAVAADPQKDSAEIRQQVMSFYQWYVKNEVKFREFALYRSINKKDAPPYKIDWTEVDKLHAYIRSDVPYLGEEFVRNQKIFLQQADSAFKVDLDSDIPYGFDYDWYTNTQEDPQYLLDELNRAKRWIIKVDGDNAIADIKGMFDDNGVQMENTLIKLALVKEKGVWKISRIGVD